MTNRTLQPLLSCLWTAIIVNIAVCGYAAAQAGGRDPGTGAPIPDNPAAQTTGTDPGNGAPIPDIPAAGTADSSHRAALARWQHAKFGLFMHWGVYSVFGGTYKGKELWSAEWIQENAKIPFDEYAATAAEWNPSDFDAESWVKTAKSAGMGYIVITAKHHDGFAMYPSKASRYNLMDWTKYRGPDPMASLKAACKKHGLLFGIYYSPLEFRLAKKGFHQPEDGDWLGKGNRYETLGPKPYATNADVVRNSQAQIAELAEWYAPDIFWFDGTWDAMGEWSEADAAQAETTIRKFAPDCLVNNRIGAKRVDFNTVEGKLPDKAPAGTWEYCWNLGTFWGYNPRNYQPKLVKTPEHYIETLVKVTSMGGNYLLNVGPDGTGKFHPMAVEYLGKIGEWLHVNGECIYGASPAPFSKPTWGYATRRENTIYLIVKEWPANGDALQIPSQDRPPKRAYRLDDQTKSPLNVDSSGQTWSVRPGKPHHPFTVIAVDLVEPSR